jgi:hypothetical protein
MKKLLIILLLIYPIHAFSQGWSFEYSMGYGSYQLDEIKSMLWAMPNRYGLEATDHFPDYYSHSGALGFVKASHHVGTNFSYLTTGGRLHREDYSGSYTFDMILNGYRFGAFYRYYINTGYSPLNIYLQVNPGVLFSSLHMKEKVKIYSESAEENNKLKGFGMFFEPSLGASYRLTNWLHLSLGGGYQVDVPNKMKLSGQDTNRRAYWDGLRFYGGFMFILPTTKSVRYE